MRCVQKRNIWEERLEADLWEKMGEGWSLSRLSSHFSAWFLIKYKQTGITV